MTESEAFECFKNANRTNDMVCVLPKSDIGKCVMQALEKQIPKKPKHTFIKHGKHTWRKNKNGEVDDFAWDFEFHNGVVCEICGETVCVLCNPEYGELTDCEEEYWNCPSCGKKIYSNLNYCDCGQKLDWGD